MHVPRFGAIWGRQTNRRLYPLERSPRWYNRHFSYRHADGDLVNILFADHVWEGSLTGRAEAVARARSTLGELQAKYGMQLRGPDGDSLLGVADRLKLTRKILAPQRTVIVCAAELKEVGAVDPCLIVPAALPLEMLPIGKAIAVGGQVVSIARSPFALSEYLTNEAWRAQGFWNGQPLPIVVAIRGEHRYLVNQKAYFFRYEKFTAMDLDQVSPIAPNERDLKMGRYLKSSDMLDQLTLIVAEY